MTQLSIHPDNYDGLSASFPELFYDVTSTWIRESPIVFRSNPQQSHQIPFKLPEIHLHTAKEHVTVRWLISDRTANKKMQNQRNMIDIHAIDFVDVLRSTTPIILASISHYLIRLDAIIHHYTPLLYPMKSHYIP